MLLPLVSVSLLLHAASVSPQTVPAKGAQEAIVTLDHAAWVVIKAQSASGTSCVLVDHVQGPFSSSGSAGRTNCAIDALLDAGTYKLRLNSKRKGKGNVALSVAEYTELNPQPVKLELRRELRQELKPQQQASFWLSIDKRQPVTIRVSGRYVGDIKLWRNGEWLEEATTQDTSPRPHAGQPIYEWWLEKELEPGTYLLTAYGSGKKPWTDTSTEDASLTVAYGFPQGTPERISTVTLGSHGLATVELPATPIAAFLSRESPAKASTRVSIHAIETNGATNMFASPEASCSIEEKALVPECSAMATRNGRHVALIRGEPGTQVSLQWAPLMQNGWAEGGYGSSWQIQNFDTSTSGEFLLAVHETPLDVDSPPLGCILEERVSETDWLERARDILPVASDRPFKRQFNYDGSSSSIWVDITRSESYLFATSGDRKNRCELYRIDGEKRTRLTETDVDATTCQVRQTVAPGRYELRIYGGTEGIETVTIAQDGLRPNVETPGKSGCNFLRVAMRKGSYRMLSTRATAGSLRALFLRPLPLTLSEPLPIILDGKSTLKIPMAAANRGIQVRSVGGGAFSCAIGNSKSEARNGVCELPGASGELVLTNPGQASLSVTLRRTPPPPPPAPPMVAFNPNIAPLPIVQPGTPLWFDFDRNESHSAAFEVKEAGLYNVTTAGLLSTNCAIRTPVIQRVGAASGGGRGRNCLVQTYLRPGRYLLTVNTVGQSKGRGGMVLERRSIKTAESVSSDSEVFFRVDANDLIQQKLNVTKGTQYSLSTAAQAGALQCRLDDPQGWPVVRIPIPCTTTMNLSKGTYLWTQLPLTVESMRRTSLESVRPTVTFKGNKPHAISFNVWHRAELGKDGKDEFTFEVPADLEIAFALTHGMQGRLYAIGADGKEKPVEVIPAMTADQTRPVQRARPQQEQYRAPPPPEEESYGDEGEARSNESEEGDEGSSYENENPEPEPEPENTGEGEQQEEEEAPPAEEVLPSANAPAPTGKALTLKAGKYKLVTEHSRGDVGITYALYLRTDIFAPGIEREVDAPGKYTIRIPVDGTLRLFTRGDLDVRCRIFDSSGALLVENAERGADWNCGLAEPLKAGDYSLVLESETLNPGATQVRVELAKVTEAPVLAASTQLKLDTGVLRAPLPPLNGDGVEELTFTGRTPFSCALEDEKGAVASRQMNVKECLLLVRSGGAAWKARLWTLANSAQVNATVATRQLTSFSGGAIKPGTAARVKVEKAGRYQTGGKIFCLPESQKGPLRSCGPEASLDEGGYVVSGIGSGESPLAMKEVVDALDKEKSDRALLSRDVTFLRQTSDATSIHLLKVAVQPGDRFPPACRIDEGVAQQTDVACFAASSGTKSSLARWWTGSSVSGEGTISRLAVQVPSSSSPLMPGQQNVTWSSGPAIRLALPSESSRVTLSLAGDAWAVQLDEKNAAVDLCAPAPTLSRCVLTGSGGNVVIYSPSEQRAQAEVIGVEGTPRKFTLTRLFESQVRTPGQHRLAIASAGADRQLQVRGALRCVTTLDDGSRVEGCDARIPGGRSGELSLDLNPGSVRAVIAEPSQLNAAALNAGANPSPSDWPTAKALKLSGLVVERSIKLAQDGVVHLRAESGVCGIAQGQNVLTVGGDDAGCTFDRLLKAGTYRIVFRGFADRTLTGSASWTTEPVKDLGEGIAAEESWVAPTQTRFFRFNTASPGHIGLGLQVSAELLDCSVLDSEQRVLGEGCQQFLQLDKGTYLLAVHAPATSRTLKFKPVLVGLAGAKAEVPEEYLRDFFNRIGVQQ